NNIMYPMGDDFHYQAARSWFKNLDKLIKHVNAANKGLKVFYSTPYCYAKALHDSKHQFTSKIDDFLPYAHAPHLYWTGFYTSRSTLKRMERVGNNWLQACKQLDVLVGNRGKMDANITRLREAMGVLQHHDAVTGEWAWEYQKSTILFRFVFRNRAATCRCRLCQDSSPWHQILPARFGTKSHQSGTSPRSI